MYITYLLSIINLLAYFLTSEKMQFIGQGMIKTKS